MPLGPLVDKRFSKRCLEAGDCPEVDPTLGLQHVVNGPVRQACQLGDIANRQSSMVHRDLKVRHQHAGVGDLSAAGTTGRHLSGRADWTGPVWHCCPF
jgi:hypothetical protein